MLRIEGLTKRFGGKAAVDNVTLSIPRGEMVGVIGRSGAGKSTLLRMLNRLADASEGRILSEERDVTALRGAALRGFHQARGLLGVPPAPAEARQHYVQACVDLLLRGA